MYSTLSKILSPRTALAGIAATAVVAAAHADPPPTLPCDLKGDLPLCIKITDVIRIAPGVIQYEFEVINWTSFEAHGLTFAVNTAGSLGVGDPFISGAFTDPNGRPIGPMESRPMGNMATVNDWSLVGPPTPTCAEFWRGTLGTPIPAPSTSIGGTTYTGLLDPRFTTSGVSVCARAWANMIPGASWTNPGQSPACISIPDLETVDDGSNVLDGFVLQLSDFTPGEQISLNWYLIGANGQPIGGISPVSGSPTGDQFGFGTLNLTLIAPAPGGVAPGPLLTVNMSNPSLTNTGYDPIDNSDPNADSARYWSENEVNGIDTYPINPIPPGLSGQGMTTCVEPGAAVSSAFMDPANAMVGFPGSQVLQGANISEPIGSPYCATNPNSTGATGQLIAGGSRSTAVNNLTLVATSLPNNTFGFFLVSQTQGFVPNAGGSEGNLCVLGNIGRYVGPGQIRNSGATGAFSLGVDLTQIPQPTGFVVAQPGDTWNFQAWFRDNAGGVPTSNFTSGLSITFI